MKKIILQVVFLLACAGRVSAYEKDMVFIDIKAADNSPETAALVLNLSSSILSGIIKKFPCLHVFTRDDINLIFGFQRSQQLVGTPIDEEMQASYDKIAKFGESKYLIVGRVQAIPINDKTFPLNRLTLRGLNRDMKNGSFFDEDELLASYDVAQSTVQRWAKELLDGFVKKASKDRWENEVCPYRGRVDVTVVTKRKQTEADNFMEYCNGQDLPGKSSKTVTGDGKQVWKLQRIGNPDTIGTAEFTHTEETVLEEIHGCYTCKSGRKGERSLKDETLAAGTASGLSYTSYTKGVAVDNKDATIRIHFSDDGTYKMAVRATTAEGTRRKTRSVVAQGTCDNVNTTTRSTETFTEPLEMSFGPFTGVVTQPKLTGKKALVVATEDNGEEREYLIDFELEWPKP